jgi:hypothetical protein
MKGPSLRVALLRAFPRSTFSSSSPGVCSFNTINSVLISHLQNAGNRNHNTKTAHSFFENVAKYKYYETTKNKNDIHDKIDITIWKTLVSTKYFTFPCPTQRLKDCCSV